MLRKGYAAVTYRAIAAEADVTPALVQYYFPALDDALLATIRRRVEVYLERLDDALRERAAEPLHVIWEFAQEATTATLMIEFGALAHHREAVRTEMARAAERIREVQLGAVREMSGTASSALGEIPLPVLVFLLTEVPKLLKLEAYLGVTTAHAEVAAAFERHLDTLEPGQGAS